jgi:hypothetical protein
MPISRCDLLLIVDAEWGCMGVLCKPQQFAEFLEQVVADWMGSLCKVQGPDIDPATAARRATLVIAHDSWTPP